MAQMSAGNAPAAPSVAALVVAEATRATAAEGANTALVAAEAVTARAAEGAALAAAAAAVMTDAALATAVNTGTTKTQLSSTFAALSPAGRDALDRQNAAALRPWHAAIAARNTAKANAVFFGSSMVEGGPGITTRSARWIEQLQAGMRAQYPLTTPAVGGLGFTPAFYQSFAAAGAPWVIGGGPLAAYGSGLGQRSYGLTTALHSATRTFTGTGADIYLATHTTIPAVAGISVDGGAVTTKDLGAVTLKAGIIHQIAGLSNASHTVAITWSSGGPVVLDGMKEYNGDETKGIHLWDGGKGSSKASDFNVSSTSRIWTPLGAIQPQLIAFEWIYNEYINNFQTTAAYATALAGCVTAALANITAPPTVLFLAFAEPNVGGYAVPYSAYVDVMRAQAAATPNGVFIDFGLPRMPAPRTDNTLGLAHVDIVHHSDKGAGYVAEVIRNVIGVK